MTRTLAAIKCLALKHQSNSKPTVQRLINNGFNLFPETSKPVKLQVIIERNIISQYYQIIMSISAPANLNQWLKPF